MIYRVVPFQRFSVPHNSDYFRSRQRRVYDVTPRVFREWQFHGGGRKVFQLQCVGVCIWYFGIVKYRSDVGGRTVIDSPLDN